MSAVETMARVFMIFTCCTFVSAALRPFNNNRNPFSNNRNQYFPRHGFANFQQGGYYQGGYFDNQNPNPGCAKTLTKADCPLFDYKSSIVNRHDFVNALSSEPVWFNIYSKEIGTENYGKCRLRYESPDANGDFVQREQCFDFGRNGCVDLTISVRLEEDECGVLKIQGVNDSTVETIHSQDINQYYLRDICVNKQGEECAGGRFIDVNVSGSRLVDRSDSSSSSSSESGHGTDDGDDVDLTGVPWDLISADLKNIYNIDFSDPEMRYVFVGIECPT
ncbi:uncharacterized protein LOC132725514 [Ruditapes philippinarum]|uniref:uncharacterized protein LOC132725514 n=1 Tax=Ruditapes philippinarum TaxID=129788 RepID=UPI00295AFD14|nr:uncharacterized protein LOC132725514 [Ruditapes philippinarum]